MVKRENKFTGTSCSAFLVQNIDRVGLRFINLLSNLQIFCYIGECGAINKWMRACLVDYSNQCDLKWHRIVFSPGGQYVRPAWRGIFFLQKGNEFTNIKRIYQYIGVLLCQYKHLFYISLRIYAYMNLLS